MAYQTDLACVADKIISVMLVGQHLLFPLQLWIGQSIFFLSTIGFKSSHWSMLVVAHASMVLAYTATSCLSNSTIRTAVIVKTSVIAFVMLVLHLRGDLAPYDESTGISLLTLIIEAALAGAWESACFQKIMSLLAVQKSKSLTRFTSSSTDHQFRHTLLRTRCLCLLVLVSGHFILPRLTHALGFPSHVSIEARPQAAKFHFITLALYGIAIELLTFSLPSVYPRLWILVSPGSPVEILSQEPPPTAELSTKYPVTGIHYVLCGFLFMALPHIIKTLVLHPISSVASGLAVLKRALHGSPDEINDLFNLNSVDSIESLLSRSSVILLILTLPLLLLYPTISRLRRAMN